MNIYIDDTYYITSDPLNYTLMKHTESTKEDGTKTSSEKPIGYFTKVEYVLEKYIKIKQYEETESFDGTLDKYLEKLYDINNDIYSKLRSLNIPNRKW